MSFLKVLQDGFPFLMQGAWVTVWISFLTLGISTVTGGALNVMALLANRYTKALITAFVYIIRGTPLVVIIFLVYHGLPFLGLQLNAYVAAVLGLSLFFTASMYETIRGSIASISKGQTEAALSLGMTQVQALRRVIFPQAIRVAIPPWVGEFTGIIKGSSLIALLSLFELTLAGREIVERTFMGMQIWSVVLAIYFVICYSLSYFSKKLEKKFQYTH